MPNEYYYNLFLIKITKKVSFYTYRNESKNIFTLIFLLLHLSFSLFPLYMQRKRKKIKGRGESSRTHFFLFLRSFGRFLYYTICRHKLSHLKITFPTQIVFSVLTYNLSRDDMRLICGRLSKFFQENNSLFLIGTMHPRACAFKNILNEYMYAFIYK